MRSLHNNLEKRLPTTSDVGKGRGLSVDESQMTPCLPRRGVLPLGHQPLPAVRDLTRDGRWSTYDVSVLKLNNVPFRGRCARMGNTLKLPSATKLARLGYFTPASQAGRLAGPVFYVYVFSLVLPNPFTHRENRIVTAALWRTFSHEGKNLTGLVRVGGARPPPFITFTITSKLQCTLQLSGQIH
jgi:hypothetical protein